MQDKIDSDIKAAMLAGDKTKAETLRGLKSAILNEAIAQGAKDEGLSDEQIQNVLTKEAKKRVEAADLYRQGGNSEKATAEMNEKEIIDAYLPEQASEDDIAIAVKEAITSTGAASAADMGKVIGAVKAKLGASADGSIIARITKEQLGS
jgi:uncharacterized protein YqeY